MVHDHSYMPPSGVYNHITILYTIVYTHVTWINNANKVTAVYVRFVILMNWICQLSRVSLNIDIDIIRMTLINLVKNSPSVDV